MGDERVPPKAVKAYVGRLKSSCIDRGYSDLTVFNDDTVERVYRGIKGMRGEGVNRERKPRTRDVLLDVLSTFNTSTREGATLHASFCLAFAGFLRAGEFTYSAKDRTSPNFGQWFVTRSSIILFDDRLELTLPSSKTDPFRNGVTLHIAATNDAGCPVASLRHLYQNFPAAPFGPLFETAPDRAFTSTLVISELRAKLKSLGYEGHYSGHSFRRGAATEARNVGLPDELIKLLGRWKSEAYLRYIEVEKAHILQASRLHQGS